MAAVLLFLAGCYVDSIHMLYTNSGRLLRKRLLDQLTHCRRRTSNYSGKQALEQYTFSQAIMGLPHVIAIKVQRKEECKHKLNSVKTIVHDNFTYGAIACKILKI